MLVMLNSVQNRWKAAEKILEQSSQTISFHLDDMYISGILRVKAGVPLFRSGLGEFAFRFRTSFQPWWSKRAIYVPDVKWQQDALAAAQKKKEDNEARDLYLKNHVWIKNQIEAMGSCQTELGWELKVGSRQFWRTVLSVKLIYNKIQ